MIDGDGNSTTVAAPWTEEQVAHIKDFQNCEYMHEFTCRDHSGLPLDVDTTHMFCQVPGCDYRQYWVHKFMTEPLRPNLKFSLAAFEKENSEHISDPERPSQTYLDTKEFCEGASGPFGVELAPYIQIVQNFLELQRNKTIDEVIERLKPWGYGMFTGWTGHTEESLIALEFAEEEFQENFKDVVQSIMEMKRE